MKLEGVTDKIFYIGPTKYAMQEHVYKIYVEVQDFVQVLLAWKTLSMFVTSYN